MKKTLCTMMLLTVFAVFCAYAQQNGVTTRYWDACKPSCAWTANASGSPNGACKSCNSSGSLLSDANAKNACESGGTAYTCMKQIPWKVNDNLSYGFAATNSTGACGKCFELSFTNTSISGKKMVVMASNIGSDVGQTHFDIMIPGGGVGIYNALSDQVTQNGGPSNPNLGQQYGGFRATCGNNKDCVRKMCTDAFGSSGLSDLKAGCDWYVDWFDIADNPNISYKEVTCPSELVSKYKGEFNNNPTPTPTTYTITFNANSGTVSPTSGTTGTDGKITNLPTPTRSNYTFNGWFTAATGGTAVNTSTVFTSNTTIYAQWTAVAATYTITFNANNGTVSPTSGTTGTNGKLTSLPTPTRSNYTFTGWFTAATGGSPVTTDYVFSANAIIYAQWTATATTYTITFNANSGTVSPTSGTTGTNGRLTSLPTPTRSNYTFDGWFTAATGGSSVTTNWVFTANTTIYAQWTAVAATSYALTTSANPSAGGTITRAPDAQTYNSGTQVTVTAAAANGYTFTRWEGASTATTASITITMDGTKTLTAVFTQQQYTVSVGRNPTAGGSVSVNGTNNPSGSVSYNPGTAMTLIATEAAGYTFENWTAVTGALPSGITATNATLTFSLGASVNIRANFVQNSTGNPTPTPTTYTVQVGRNPAEGGSVSVNGTSNPNGSVSLNSGTAMTLTATAATGYTFNNWTAVTGAMPSGVTATNATLTFTLSANVNIRANFTQNSGGGGGDPTKLTLQLDRNPVAGGNVSVTFNGEASTNPAQKSYGQWDWLVIKAVPSSNYEFVNWTETAGTLPSSVTKTNPDIAFNGVTGNLTLTANFKSSSGGGVIEPPPGGGGNWTAPANRTDTTKVEAEDYVSSGANANMKKSTNNGITNIGYIESGYTTTYNVGMDRAGAYTMVFRMASNYDQGDSRFYVTVNGTSVGTIVGHTKDWDGYTDVGFDFDVMLNAGSNTITLNFQTPINVDYFLILGEPAPDNGGGPPPTSVRNAKTVKNRTAISLKSVSGGFSVMLPTNHGYTSYKIINLRGKTIRSGKIGAGTADLRFNNINRSVMFLKLEGGVKGSAPVVLKAVTY